MSNGVLVAAAAGVAVCLLAAGIVLGVSIAAADTVSTADHRAALAAAEADTRDRLRDEYERGLHAGYARGVDSVRDDFGEVVGMLGIIADGCVSAAVAAAQDQGGEVMGWEREDGWTSVRWAGPLRLAASITGVWSVCGVDDGMLRLLDDDGGTPSYGRVEGDTPDARLANAKAAAEDWCRSMARTVLAEMGDD